jgi:hypothetical protein
MYPLAEKRSGRLQSTTSRRPPKIVWMVRCRSAGTIHAHPHKAVMKTTENVIDLSSYTSVIRLTVAEWRMMRRRTGIVTASRLVTFVVDDRLGPRRNTETAQQKKTTNLNWAAKSGAPQKEWLIMLNNQQRNSDTIA